VPDQERGTIFTYYLSQFPQGMKGGKKDSKGKKREVVIVKNERLTANLLIYKQNGKGEKGRKEGT